MLVHQIILGKEKYLLKIIKDKLKYILIMITLLASPAYSNDKALSVINNFLDNTTSIKADFYQTSGNNVERGILYLNLPNKFHFKYKNNITIISNGTWIIIKDYNKRSSTRVLFNKTPIKVILNKNTYKEDILIKESISFYTVYFKNENTSLRIFFHKESGYLSGWEIIYNSSEYIKVNLENIHTNIEIPDDKFLIKDFYP